MERYKDFAPSAMDTKGLRADELNIGDWLIAPVSRNRDSGILAESNWCVVLEDIGGEGEDVQIHRFGHWANGWFEIILVRPGSRAAECAEKWENTLSEYPCASDEDYSNRQQKEIEKIWREANYRGRLDFLDKSGSMVNYMCVRRDTLPPWNSSGENELYNYLIDNYAE